MHQFLGLVWAGLFSALAHADISASCALVSSIPAQAELGFANVENLVFPEDGQSPASLLFTVGAPASVPGIAGQVLDLAQKPPRAPLPTRFVFGDGGTSAGMLPFVSVDLRKGSSLSRWLGYLLGRIAQRGVDLADRDAVLEFLRTNIWSLLNDTQPVACVARALQAQASVSSSSQEKFAQMSGRPVSAQVFPTGQTYPVVPFEVFVQQYHPYCIHEEMLAALLLQKLGYPFQIVTGYEADSPHSRVMMGHTWLRVDADRELDVEWNRLGPPEQNPEVPSWERVANGWGGPNAHWPILALEP